MPDKPRQKGERPTIPPATRKRIRAFVKAVAALQKQHHVEIYSQDGAICFRDVLRDDEWEGYGDFDAMIFDEGPIRIGRLRFEDFDAWGE